MLYRPKELAFKTVTVEPDAAAAAPASPAPAAAPAPAAEARARRGVAREPGGGGSGARDGRAGLSRVGYMGREEREGVGETRSARARSEDVALKFVRSPL